MQDAPNSSESGNNATSMSTEHPRGRSGLSLKLRSRILSGLVLVLPIWITFVVATFVFRLMRDASLWLVEAILLSPFGEPLLMSWGLPSEDLSRHGLDALPASIQWSISSTAVVLTIVLLYVLGAIATNVVGKRIIRLAERVVERVPFVAVVYHASKSVLETLTGEGAKPFQRVVLAPFPNRETHSIGFVTRVTHDARTGETLYTVFVATAPNPTTGFVFIVKPSEVVELDWTVEEAIKVIMSGGVLMPSELPMPRNANAGITEPAKPAQQAPSS
jgi:uncharacterized membrane protein